MRPIAAALVLSLLGCVTKREMRDLPSDAGVARTYDAPFDKVKLACQDAAEELGFHKSESEKDTRFVAPKLYQIIAGQGVREGTIGRRLRIRIENKDPQCTVWVVVRAKVDNPDTDNIDNAIAKDLHERITKRLAK